MISSILSLLIDKLRESAREQTCAMITKNVFSVSLLPLQDMCHIGQLQIDQMMNTPTSDDGSSLRVQLCQLTGINANALHVGQDK